MMRVRTRAARYGRQGTPSRAVRREQALVSHVPHTWHVNDAWVSLISWKHVWKAVLIFFFHHQGVFFNSAAKMTVTVLHNCSTYYSADVLCFLSISYGYLPQYCCHKLPSVIFLPVTLLNESPQLSPPESAALLLDARSTLIVCSRVNISPLFLCIPTLFCDFLCSVLTF